jgi:putative transposase
VQPNALLHHSDQGSQYISEQFQQLIPNRGIVRRTSRAVIDNGNLSRLDDSIANCHRGVRATARIAHDLPAK